MATRDIYLKIETIPDYSPVEPDDHVSPPIQYRRDCMRNMGHEDGMIPADEVAARRLTALIYREYLDPQYLVPKPDKLVAADVNEPAFTRHCIRTLHCIQDKVSQERTFGFDLLKQALSLRAASHLRARPSRQGELS